MLQNEKIRQLINDFNLIPEFFTMLLCVLKNFGGLFHSITLLAVVALLTHLYIYDVTIVIHKSHNLVGTEGIVELGPK